MERTRSTVKDLEVSLLSKRFKPLLVLWNHVIHFIYDIYFFNMVKLVLSLWGKLALVSLITEGYGNKHCLKPYPYNQFMVSCQVMYPCDFNYRNSCFCLFFFFIQCSTAVMYYLHGFE